MFNGARIYNFKTGFRKYYAAFTKSPGPALALFFGLFSIFVTFDIKETIGEANWVFLLLSVFVLILMGVVSFILGAQLSLKTMPPDTYAEVLIAGRSDKEAICTLAYHIRDSCREWADICAMGSLVKYENDLKNKEKKYRENIDPESKEKGAKKLKPNEARAELAKDFMNFFEKHAPANQKVIECLRSDRVRQNTKLKRIKAMKYKAADELAIPVFRLCDHLVQYSPDLSSKLMAKYLRNYEEMSSTYKKLNETNVVRFLRLIGQNSMIKDEADNIVETQNALIQKGWLSEHIHALSSTDSTSTSLKIYARALEEIAERYANTLERWWNRWPRDRSRSILTNCEEELLFFYKKTTGAPGIRSQFYVNKAL